MDRLPCGAAGRDAALAVALDQEQEFVGRIDHESAGAFVAVIVDELLFKFRIEGALGGLRISLLAKQLLRFASRKQLMPRTIGLLLIRRLRLIGRLLLITPALGLTFTEQELDEAAAHIGALGISHLHRRDRLLRGSTGVDHGGFARRRGFDRRGLRETGD